MSIMIQNFKSLQEENQSLRAEVLRLRSNREYDQEQNATLKRLLFGAKSEKSKTIPLIPGQLHFPEFSILEGVAETGPPALPKTDSKKRRSAGKVADGSTPICR